MLQRRIHLKQSNSLNPSTRCKQITNLLTFITPLSRLSVPKTKHRHKVAKHNAESQTSFSLLQQMSFFLLLGFASLHSASLRWACKSIRFCSLVTRSFASLDLKLLRFASSLGLFQFDLLCLSSAHLHFAWLRLACSQFSFVHCRKVALVRFIRSRFDLLGFCYRRFQLLGLSLFRLSFSSLDFDRLL